MRQNLDCNADIGIRGLFIKQLLRIVELAVSLSGLRAFFHACSGIRSILFSILAEERHDGAEDRLATHTGRGICRHRKRRSRIARKDSGLTKPVVLCLAPAHRFGAAIDVVPINVLKKRVDVSPCVGAIVDRVRMLVHIHHEKRYAPSKAISVIPSPVVVDCIVAEIIV